MEVHVLLGLFLAALMQVNAGLIQFDEMPKSLKDMIQHSQACSIIVGPTVMEHLPMELHDSSRTEYPEDSPSLNKLSGCIFKKMEIVDEKSKINTDALADYVWGVATISGKTSAESRQSASDVATECSSVKGSDYGQTAVKIQNCILHVSAEKGLFNGFDGMF